MAITLGRTNSPFVPQQPIQGDPNAFTGKEAIVSGLSNLGAATQSLAEKILAERKQAQDNHNRFLAHTAVSEFQGKMDRRFIEVQQNIAEDGSNFVEPFMKEYTAGANDVLARIDPQLRDEFNARLAAVGEAYNTSAFGVAVERRNDFYRTKISDTAKAALAAINNNPDNFEEARATAAELINSSNLPIAERNKLLKVLDETTRDAVVAGLARRQAAGTVPPTKTRNGITLQWSQAPAVAKRLLSVIASVEAKDYNIINGGGTFTSYHDHPRVKGENSTAAGLFQIIVGTWDGLVRKYPELTDFSPENQEKAAWFLARDNYMAHTGRDLEKDLLSGDPAVLAQVRRALAGSGSGAAAKGVTWEGLQTLSDEEFITRFNDHADILNDPRLKDTPRPVIANALLAAETDADTERKEALLRDKAAAEAAFNEILRQAENKELSFSEILALRKNLTAPQINKLDAVINSQYKEAKELYDATTRVLDPHRTMSALNSDDVAAVDKVINTKALDAFASGDNVAWKTMVEPLITAKGIVPPKVVSTLKSMVATGDPKLMRNAFDAIDGLRYHDPEILKKSLPEELQIAYTRFTADKKYYSDPEHADILRRRYSPEMLAKTDAYRKEAQNYLRQNPVSVTDIVDTLDGFNFQVGIPHVGSVDLYSKRAEAPVIGEERFLLKADFDRLFEEEFLWRQDPGEAKAVALQRLGRIWGVTRVDPEHPRLMRYPPENYYKQKGNDDMTWFTNAARSELKVRNEAGDMVEPAGRLIFVPHESTPDEVAANAAPSYKVFELNENNEPILISPAEEGWFPDEKDVKMAAAVPGNEAEDAFNRSNLVRGFPKIESEFLQGGMSESDFRDKALELAKEAGADESLIQFYIDRAVNARNVREGTARFDSGEPSPVRLPPNAPFLSGRTETDTGGPALGTEAPMSAPETPGTPTPVSGGSPSERSSMLREKYESLKFNFVSKALQPPDFINELRKLVYSSKVENPEEEFIRLRNEAMRAYLGG